MPAIPQWTGAPSIKGSSEGVRMALLTASLIGLQFTWNVEMTYCTPYLLSLGLTKSRISLVWVAGPLSGLIMQPIVGVVADRSTSRLGRRRPFMLCGMVLVALFLMLLGWTKEVVLWFVPATDANTEWVATLTIATAVAAIYGIDFAINAVQGSCRGLVVDTLPIPKQQMGSSWASRMVAVGNLVGYGAGAIDLQAVFGEALGDTQFKQLTAVAAITLCVMVSITSWAVTERVLVSDGRDEGEGLGLRDVVSTIAHKARNLPRGIAGICMVQFFAWIGWFPFLFYSTTWVGEIYLRYEAPAELKAASDVTGQVGRIGSTALIAFSIITFTMSVVLPWFVRNPLDETPGYTQRPPKSIATVLLELEKYKPSLLTAWTASHCIFAASMIMTPFVTSLRSATILVGICGVSWAISVWAPFAFLGVEINRLSQPSHNHNHDHNHQNHTYTPLPRRSTSISLAPSSPTTQLTQLHVHHASEEHQGATGESSGAYLGIMNLYTTLPQFVGTFISWAVFSILEPGKEKPGAEGAIGDEARLGAKGEGDEGPNAIAVCLFIGAVSAVVAAWATRRLGRIHRELDSRY